MPGTVSQSAEYAGRLLGLSGPWRFYGRAVGAGCQIVRFYLFRTAFDLLRSYGHQNSVREGVVRQVKQSTPFRSTFCSEMVAINSYVNIQPRFSVEPSNKFWKVISQQTNKLEKLALPSPP